jgi:hypothetical protein
MATEASIQAGERAIVAKEEFRYALTKRASYIRYANVDERMAKEQQARRERHGKPEEGFFARLRRSE